MTELQQPITIVKIRGLHMRKIQPQKVGGNTCFISDNVPTLTSQLLPNSERAIFTSFLPHHHLHLHLLAIAIAIAMAMADRQAPSGSSDHQILLFPFMAQGHIIPFLSLARLLERTTPFSITLVNTPFNIHKLRAALPTTSSIRLLPLPYSPTDHGLPPGADNTDCLPYPLLLPLLLSSATLRPAFEQLVASISPPPLCIIADMFLGWTVEVAARFGVFHSVFIPGGAYGSAVYFSLWLNLPHARTDDDEFPLPDFPEARCVQRSQMSPHLAAADGSDGWSLFLQRQLSLCLKSNALLLNTAEGLESSGLAYFRRMAAGEVRLIGPILLLAGGGHGGPVRQPGVALDKCVQWLDRHGPSSVLYVCFGSMNTISSSQMVELAVALEGSGKPFIWVVRPPLEEENSDEFKDEWLPAGFEARVGETGKGLLVRRWAQQAEILAHPSTGAFLSHCGWNSVVESLTQGVPIIGWPLSAEQFYNSKLLEEELGVCVEVGRGNRSEVRRERVAEAIGVVLGTSEKGLEMRRKALEVKEVLAGAVRDEHGFKGSSIRAMDELIHSLPKASNFKQSSEDLVR